jgi:hypothetical protein
MRIRVLEDFPVGISTWKAGTVEYINLVQGRRLISRGLAEEVVDEDASPAKPAAKTEGKPKKEKKAKPSVDTSAYTTGTIKPGGK